QRLTRERNIDLEHLSSIVVLQGKASYVRSTGVLKASLHLQQPWAFLARIGLVFPAFIRDGVYRLVARSRYTFFGKKDACRLPTQQEAMQLLG
ncbi:MAG: thiol-disulfide oxidoreductase DCC family protein, partial [Salibacteraceae bacterium]